MRRSRHGEQQSLSTGDHLAEEVSAEDDKVQQDVPQEEQEPVEQIHPTRQLMLADEDKAQANSVALEGDDPGDGQRRRTRRPGYYDKQLTKAEQRRAEAEERAKDFQRRNEEREKKMAERERFRRAMAKTRGPDGKKKLGRESTLLLDKVKRLVADS